MSLGTRDCGVVVVRRLSYTLCLHGQKHPGTCPRNSMAEYHPYPFEEIYSRSVWLEDLESASETLSLNPINPYPSSPILPTS